MLGRKRPPRLLERPKGRASLSHGRSTEKGWGVTVLLWEAQSHGRGVLAWSLKKSPESEHPGPAEPSPSGVETSQ